MNCEYGKHSSLRYSLRGRIILLAFVGLTWPNGWTVGQRSKANLESVEKARRIFPLLRDRLRFGTYASIARGNRKIRQFAGLFELC